MLLPFDGLFCSGKVKGSALPGVLSNEPDDPADEVGILVVLESASSWRPISGA